MKLSTKNLNNLSKAFPADLHGILVYGPDAGHVDEVSRKIGKSHVEDLRDPFQVEEIGFNLAKEDPALLSDAIMSLSMTGGNRLVIVRECTDALASTLEEIGRFELTEAKLLILAGSLSPRSKLRKVFEESKRLGALPCYTDQEGDLKSLIQATMDDAGISIKPDAMDYLISHLGSDRLTTRAELDKLILYAGADDKLDLQSVVELVGDGGPMVLDAIAWGVADANIETLLLALNRYDSTSQNPISCLRTTISHFQKLRTARTLLDQGYSPKDAAASLRPPIFWNKVPQFQKQLTQWSIQQINGALNRLSEAEALCKTTGYPSMTIASQILLGVCIKGSKRISSG